MEAPKKHRSEGNMVGIDPHKHTLSATVLDERGGCLATEHFKVSGDGHRDLERWATGFGSVARWVWGAFIRFSLVSRAFGPGSEAGLGLSVEAAGISRTPTTQKLALRG